VRVSWLRSTFECPPDLIALFGSVVVVLVPQTLLFEEVFEATRGLLRTILRRVLVTPQFSAGVFNPNEKVNYVDFGQTTVNLGHHLENITDKP
jgi:hypothetical protein